MILQPGEVVVVVHLLQDLGAHDGGHFGAHPVASCVGIAPRHLHTGDVLPAEVRVCGKDHRIHVHAVAPAAGLDEVGGELVAKAAGAEVHPAPDPPALVDEEIDEVVS